MFGQPAPAASAVLLYLALHAQECRWRRVPCPWEVTCLVNQPTSDQHLSSENGGFWLHIGYAIRQSGPGLSSVSRNSKAAKCEKLHCGYRVSWALWQVLLKQSMYSYSVTDLKDDLSFKALEHSQQGIFLWQWSSCSSSQMTHFPGQAECWRCSPKH